eukprot:TRINITY_DN4246_c1_g1_i2.p1 TRINITY_DN4246_c1_g1~~TRINITY_DN4246_c1_g1_i2.p1  ORF type:complete len:291 (+),score=47.13 TRINITY_DN4246_c1_g1_i2:290-1162(+)
MFRRWNWVSEFDDVVVSSSHDAAHGEDDQCKDSAAMERVGGGTSPESGSSSAGSVFYDTVHVPRRSTHGGFAVVSDVTFSRATADRHLFLIRRTSDPRLANRKIALYVGARPHPSPNSIFLPRCGPLVAACVRVVKWSVVHAELDFAQRTLRLSQWDTLRKMCVGEPLETPLGFGSDEANTAEWDILCALGHGGTACLIDDVSAWEWSPRLHVQYPLSTRQVVETLLLVHAAHDAFSLVPPEVVTGLLLPCVVGVVSFYSSLLFQDLPHHKSNDDSPTLSVKAANRCECA